MKCKKLQKVLCMALAAASVSSTVVFANPGDEAHDALMGAITKVTEVQKNATAACVAARAADRAEKEAAEKDWMAKFKAALEQCDNTLWALLLVSELENANSQKLADAEKSLSTFERLVGGSEWSPEYRWIAEKMEATLIRAVLLQVELAKYGVTLATAGQREVKDLSQVAGWKRWAEAYKRLKKADTWQEHLQAAFDGAGSRWRQLDAMLGPFEEEK
ncbi:hypothetical protein FACS1894198_5480 [Clostridia bacterium]|nr:hypothetical protein FACS1894198_5480 [Clostridia bacterium]